MEEEQDFGLYVTDTDIYTLHDVMAFLEVDFARALDLTRRGVLFGIRDATLKPNLPPDEEAQAWLVTGESIIEYMEQKEARLEAMWGLGKPPRVFVQ